MKKKTLELLKSGNFTLAYHDSNYCCLYEGHIKYDNIVEDSEVESFSDSVLGYVPEEVVALVKALGGKVDSI